MNKKSIRDIQWQGKRAVVRVDFNVPIEHGVIGDDTRIRSAVPTIQYLVDHGASVVLMSHLGRPKNTVVESLRLKPVAAHLAELLNKSVTAIPDVAGPNALSAAKALGAGQILMLENTRFDAREEANDPSLAKEYAALGDVYVNDAFGAAHRAHASTAGIAAYLPAVAGLLMERELEALAGTLANPERPFITIIGGAKISDKIGVIENLLSKVDALLIGGGMANTFLLAQGYAMGDSLVETASLDLAKRMIDLAAARGTKLLLPTDAVVADAFRRLQIPWSWRSPMSSPAGAFWILDQRHEQSTRPKSQLQRPSFGMVRWAYSKCRHLQREHVQSHRRWQIAVPSRLWVVVILLQPSNRWD